MDKGQTFQEFVCLCARAMGACILMRDDSMDAPIPEKFEPSDYHIKAKASAISLLARLEVMSTQEAIEYGERQRQELIASTEKSLATRIAEEGRLSEMERKVQEWEPPTPDHRHFKEFMLEQLNISHTGTDYLTDSLAHARTTSPMFYYTKEVEGAKHSIKYHEEEHAKEVECQNGRSEWIRQLRESIK